MPELIANIHMHTRYSDGFSSHAEIAQIALDAGLDIVIVTDHNILVEGFEGYTLQGGKRLLMLVGEEIHNRTRDPQKNHMLILGVKRELAPFASDPQRLIDLANHDDGLTFLAHPVDPALPLFQETDISWEDWNIHGYTGLELWNNMSEIKVHVHSRIGGLFYVLFPGQIAHQPHPKTLAIWDSLLAAGKKVVVLGGSDAHATPMKMGPFRRTVLPYAYHFTAINTHLIVPHTLSGALPDDRSMVLKALKEGHTFIGYDLPAETRGFTFTAQGESGYAQMGDTLENKSGITFQIRCPQRCEIRLIKDGALVKAWNHNDSAVYFTKEVGTYRVECYLNFLGIRRGWIFSNPITLLPKTNPKFDENQ